MRNNTLKCLLCGNEVQGHEKYCHVCITKHETANICSRIRYVMLNKAKINMGNRIRGYYSKYGFGESEYKAMVVKQSHRCAGCGELLQEDKPNAVHVDHDHKTNKVRGVLCHNCNGTLVQAKDSIPRLNSLITYLIKHTNKGNL